MTQPSTLNPHPSTLNPQPSHSMVAKADTHLHLSALLTSPELFAYLGEIYERDGKKPFDDKETIGEVMCSPAV